MTQRIGGFKVRHDENTINAASFSNSWDLFQNLASFNIGRKQRHVVYLPASCQCDPETLCHLVSLVFVPPPGDCHITSYQKHVAVGAGQMPGSSTEDGGSIEPPDPFVLASSVSVETAGESPESSVGQVLLGVLVAHCNGHCAFMLWQIP